MHGIEEIIYKYNIPTLFTTLEFDIPTTVQPGFKIGLKMPTQIGMIYGVSIYTDNFSALNNPQITTTNAQNLYLQLKQGSADFIDMQRLDDFLFTFTGVPTLPAKKYLNVRIPGKFSLDQSKIMNPTGIVSVPPVTTVINLNLWYIEIPAWEKLKKNNIVMDFY